jgi:hypothetical protein
MANYNNQCRLKFDSNKDVKYSCYGCTKETGRKEGCHSTCEKYIEERKKADIDKAKRNKAKEQDRLEIDYIKATIKRMSGK